MTPEELNQLFPAYADCAVSVGKDRVSSARPNQPPTPKRRKKPRDREGNRADAAATSAEVEDKEYEHDGHTANNAAENILRKNQLSEFDHVPLPHTHSEWPTALGAQA